MTDSSDPVTRAHELYDRARVWERERDHELLRKQAETDERIVETLNNAAGGERDA